MEDGIEKKILQEMSERLVAMSSEIFGFFESRKDVTPDMVKSATRGLVEKGFLKVINMAETSYAITQKGMKETNFRCL